MYDEMNTAFGVFERYVHPKKGNIRFLFTDSLTIVKIWPNDPYQLASVKVWLGASKDSIVGNWACVRDYDDADDAQLKVVREAMGLTRSFFSSYISTIVIACENGSLDVLGSYDLFENTDTGELRLLFKEAKFVMKLFTEVPGLATIKLWSDSDVGKMTQAWNTLPTTRDLTSSEVTCAIDALESLNRYHEQFM